MDDEVKATEVLAYRVREGVEVRILRDVAGQDQRLLQALRQVTDVLLEPLPLVRDSETSSLARDGLGDPLGDRALVGDANDEALFSLEQHPILLSQSGSPARRKPSERAT